VVSAMPNVCGLIVIVQEAGNRSLKLQAVHDQPFAK
jgi:hypothetical protein